MPDKITKEKFWTMYKDSTFRRLSFAETMSTNFFTKWNVNVLKLYSYYSSFCCLQPDIIFPTKPHCNPFFNYNNAIQFLSQQRKYLIRNNHKSENSLIHSKLAKVAAVINSHRYTCLIQLDVNANIKREY